MIRMMLMWMCLLQGCLIHGQPSIATEQRPTHTVIRGEVLGRLRRAGRTDNGQDGGGGGCNERHLLRGIMQNDLICKTLENF